MFRLTTPLFALAVFAAAANAQHHHQLPLSPGVMPGSRIGPGMQFIPQSAPRFVPSHGIGGGVVGSTYRNTGVFRTSGYRSVGLGYGYGRYGYGGFGYGGYGYGYGYPYGYGYGYPYFGYWSPGALFPPADTNPGIPLANEFPAVLTIQFPSASQVWLNGDQMKDEDAEEHVLTSRSLKPDETYTFNVKLRWMAGGKTYETKRAVTLKSGERSRLLVLSGDEVKE